MARSRGKGQAIASSTAGSNAEKAVDSAVKAKHDPTQIPINTSLRLEAESAALIAIPEAETAISKKKP